MIEIIFPIEWHEVDIRIWICKTYDVTWFKAGEMMRRDYRMDNWFIKV